MESLQDESVEMPEMEPALYPTARPMFSNWRVVTFLPVLKRASVKFETEKFCTVEEAVQKPKMPMLEVALPVFKDNPIIFLPPPSKVPAKEVPFWPPTGAAPSVPEKSRFLASLTVLPSKSTAARSALPSPFVSAVPFTRLEKATNCSMVLMVKVSASGFCV